MKALCNYHEHADDEKTIAACRRKYNQDSTGGHLSTYEWQSLENKREKLYARKMAKLKEQAFIRAADAKNTKTPRLARAS